MRGSTGFVKPVLIILVAVAVVVALAFVAAGMMGGNKDHGKAVDFTATDINGDDYTLSSAYGKRPTVLVFLGKVTAADGKEAMTGDTLLKHLDEAIGDTDVRTVVVARDDDGSFVQSYFKETGAQADVILPDQELTISQLYNVTACPITYFIDKNGSVRSVSLSNLTRSAAQKYVGYITQ